MPRSASFGQYVMPMSRYSLAAAAACSRPGHGPPQEPPPQRRDDPEVQAAASDRATMTTELPCLALFIRCRGLTRNAAPDLGQACG